MWDQVARKMEKKVTLVRVDATRQKEEEMKTYQLRGYPGYPVIKLIAKDGASIDVFEYEPSGWMTTMETIAIWIGKHLQTDHVLTSFEEFKSFHFENKNFVIGLFDSDDHTDALAGKVDVFAEVSDLLKQPTVVLLYQFLAAASDQSAAWKLM